MTGRALSRSRVGAKQAASAYGAAFVPFERTFAPEHAPAWMDHVALLGGWRPPNRSEAFTYCDLGCGQGVTPVVLAATHPRGDFHGIDTMAAHIAHGRRLARDAGVGNVTFHLADIASPPPLPRFDYIALRGVYTWVDDTTKAAIRRFVDRRLKPGGLLLVGYNAMPGWAASEPLQKLIRMTFERSPGSPGERLYSAVELVRKMVGHGVPSIVASPGARRMTSSPVVQEAYVAHEFLVKHWRPMYATDLRAELAPIAVVFAGCADLIDNHDAWSLRSDDRAFLAGVTNADLRRFVREFLLPRALRLDVFTRGARRIGEREQRRRLIASTFALTGPESLVKYSHVTSGGRLVFDNAAARSIVAGLGCGPMSLFDIASMARLSARDMLANALALCAVDALRPVEPGAVSVERLNRTILERLGRPDELNVLALSCGTALTLKRRLLEAMRDGTPLRHPRRAAWRSFLEHYGVR